MFRSRVFRVRGFATAILVLTLSACVVPRVAETDFTQGVGLSKSQTSSWALDSVEVIISPKLTVTNSPGIRYPSLNELVWFGDPPGNRKVQVIELMSDAVRAGAQDALTGSSPVVVKLLVTEFHAMTPRARSSQLQLGVHEIMFDISVVDASGAAIASETAIRADLKAFSGATAVQAEQSGQGQKIRIQGRVAQVIRSWLNSAG